MQIPFRSVLFIFLVSSLISLLFLFQGPRADFLSFEKPGRVLGVSEEALHYVSSLPENNDIPRPRKTGSEPIDIGDSGGYLMDIETEEVLFESNADRIAPVASITKLATALVFLDLDPDWDLWYRITSEDRVDGGRIYVYQGEEIRARDLFNLSLIASANTATKALVASTGLAEDDFVMRMNLKMGELGLKNTKFVDPVGIGQENVSTPREIAVLAKAAFSKPRIREAVLKSSYSFTTGQGRQRTVYSTDQLLETNDGSIVIEGGKTGHLPEAGYCFAGRFSGEDGNSLISVYLGGKTNQSRFTETKKMVDWAFANYEWK